MSHHPYTIIAGAYYFIEEENAIVMAKHTGQFYKVNCDIYLTESDAISSGEEIDQDNPIAYQTQDGTLYFKIKGERNVDADKMLLYTDITNLYCVGDNEFVTLKRKMAQSPDGRLIENHAL